jgi:hypothetical protein
MSTTFTELAVPSFLPSHKYVVATAYLLGAKNSFVKVNLTVGDQLLDEAYLYLRAKHMIQNSLTHLINKKNDINNPVLMYHMHANYNSSSRRKTISSF